MKISDIESKILSYKSEDKKIFVTSSFQTHSIPLLHILSKIDAEIDVLFINTGFHFPETLLFRDKLTREFNLNLIDVHSLVPKNLQRDKNGQFYFATDPDYCCYLNKTQAIEPYLMQYDIWVNGIRSDQNSNRKSMEIEQKAPFGTLRFHPLLDWNSKMIYDYRKKYNLPEHPLDSQGYLSIGCEPCTRKVVLENDRGGRWFGMKKTECGLHTDLVEK